MSVKKLFLTVLFGAYLFSCSSNKELMNSSKNNQPNVKDFLTIEEAVANLKLPESVLPYNPFTGVTSTLAPSFRPPYRAVQPIKVFDNLYFVGTSTVGAYVVETEEGLVLIDAGIGDETAIIMVDGMKQLGLDPSQIKLVLLSHEHFDHYGGVPYLKKNICPDAKVALSLVGWNMLQTVPPEWAYVNPRPESVDIYFVDGMKIKVGSEVFQIIATPGHSPGCVSFIFPVFDNGEKHMAGLMGGSAVWPTQTETQLYKASVEYFSAFAKATKCDVGLNVHSSERDFTQLRQRKPDDPHPMILGKDEFDTIYLNRFRVRYSQMLNSGDVPPYKSL